MVPRRLSHAQENPVTAIDIALEPDATMVRQAEADNARLLKAYPEGFALDATHHAHITMLQQFVRTADLKKVYSAANAVLAKEGVASRRLKAINYYYIPSPPLGIAGIVVESTEDLLRLQYELLDAVAPFTEKTGTAAAFVSTDGGRDIQQGLIDSDCVVARSSDQGEPSSDPDPIAELVRLNRRISCGRSALVAMPTGFELVAARTFASSSRARGSRKAKVVRDDLFLRQTEVVKNFNRKSP